MVLCEPVLTEAVFLLPQEAQRLRLSALVRELALLPLALEYANEFRAEVFRWLGHYAEHRPDWADATLAVACGKEPKARVWTYDSEFRTTWRRPNGTKIPLAPG
jgi:predicted nucleic acid-binding protein